MFDGGALVSAGDPSPYDLPVVRPQRPRPASMPRWEPQNDPFADDPYFWDPADGIGLPHSPAYDSLRHAINRARDRVRNRHRNPYI